MEERRYQWNISSENGIVVKNRLVFYIIVVVVGKVIVPFGVERLIGGGVMPYSEIRFIS